MRIAVFDRPTGKVTLADLAIAALRIEDKIEDKRNGVDVSLCVVPLAKPVAFREAVLDAHGTIQAGINLLHRVFMLKKKTEVLFGSGIMPVWEFKAKRDEKAEKNDRFDLFVIAHWQEWNEAGILWDERNSIAQCDKSGVSLGPMKLGAFKVRCGKRGLGLRYLLGYIG